MEVENKTNTEGQNVGTVETPVSTDAVVNGNVAENATVAPAQKPKSNNTVIILVVVFGLLFLCCACSVGGYFWSKSQVDSLVNELETQEGNITEELNNLNDELENVEKEFNDNKDVIDTPENIDWDNDSENVYTPDFEKMPGTTICDPTLCSDIWFNVSVLGSVYTSCYDLELDNTKLESKSSDSKEWSETWTLKGCGKSYDFSVSYEADPAGGTNFVVSKKF